MPGVHCSHMRQVSMVTCILLRYTKIKTNFSCLIPRCGEGGGEKGVPGVYCMRMCFNFPKFLENLITSGHLRYTDFCKVADF